MKNYALSCYEFSDNYIATKSRHGPLHRLYDQLLLRELRIKNPDLRKTGTRATVLEGDTGIGKSILVIEGLRALGFQELTNVNEVPNNDRYYYYLTPTNFDQMEEILIKAFNEGAIVVVDELNTLAALESLLNNLLSGRYKEKVSPKEGFLLIGTQNQANKYKNRVKLSEPLSNRSRVEPIKNYNEGELIKIMTHKLKDEDKAIAEVKEYKCAEIYANFFNKHPKPAPRNLFRQTRLSHTKH